MTFGWQGAGDRALEFPDGVPVAGPFVVVENRTLVAAADATVANNNNVLAALIGDLQVLGLVA